MLVALALIEGGMKYEDAVQFIRQKRRGAFNSKQLLYLENIVLRCGCASKTPMVIETTVAFNKTGVPNAIALKKNLRQDLICHTY